MPTNNVAPYVKEAVESVLQQTYNDFELLVIDDCSSDETISVVHEINDPRIHIVKNKKNVGLAENLNRGLSLIETEYVARMDGDDIALPHWLQSEVDFLDKHPEVGVCGGGAQRFGTSQSLVRLPEWHDDIAANMLFECSILVPTIRMSIIREHNLCYCTDAFPAEDYRFWADCLKVTRLHNIPDTLFRYRMHPTQICTARRKEQNDKVALVQQLMLKTFNPKVTDKDLEFFTTHFFAPIIDRDDFMQRQQFASRILLPKQLHNRLRQILYNTIVQRYFSEGYTPRAYLHYLNSRMSYKTGEKNELRFLIKSILLRHK